MSRKKAKVDEEIAINIGDKIVYKIGSRGEATEGKVVSFNPDDGKYKIQLEGLYNNVSVHKRFCWAPASKDDGDIEINSAPNSPDKNTKRRTNQGNISCSTILPSLFNSCFIILNHLNKPFPFLN